MSAFNLPQWMHKDFWLTVDEMKVVLVIVGLVDERMGCLGTLLIPSTAFLFGVFQQVSSANKFLLDWTNQSWFTASTCIVLGLNHMQLVLVDSKRSLSTRKCRWDVICFGSEWSVTKRCRTVQVLSIVSLQPSRWSQCKHAAQPLHWFSTEI